MTDLNAAFNNLTVNGSLGDPHGIVPYAYRRASTERHAEESSRFPRLLESFRNAARRDHPRIYSDVILIDRWLTGFEIEHGPALLKHHQ